MSAEGKIRVLVLSASVGSGHVRAADALAKAFRERPEVGEVLSDDSLDHTNILHKQFYSALYKRLSEVTPEFLGWWYETSDDPWVTDRVRLLIDLPQALPLVNLIRDFRPDKVVCTHFMPAGVLAHFLRREQIKIELSIVVTDFHFHAMWIARAFHQYFVSQEEDRIHMEALGLPGDRVRVTGIPIDPSFADEIDRKAVCRRFRLDPDIPILLVAGGTLGLSPSTAVVRRLLRLELPFQAVVVCGKNEEMRGEIETLVADESARFRVLGYTTEMRDLMGISTLLLSKPGGLTTAEALACGLPMVILDPIGGQEERNSDMLLENGAAVKCGEVTVLAHKLTTLLSDPDRLKQMSANAKRLGRPDAARSVVQYVLSGEHSEPKTISRRDERNLRKAIDN
jgi:processive 1,2-diacylglycerol beta-glucosyltransferase